MWDQGGAGSPDTDVRMMRLALQEANKAYEIGEVPVGAVVAAGGRVLARAHNLTERLTDVTAHAEILALTAATEGLGGKYLTGCTLYVTLEPCVMCAGALYWARPERIVYGASDPKRGYIAVGGPGLVHPKTRVIGGVLGVEAGALLQEFFRQRRA